MSSQRKVDIKERSSLPTNTLSSVVSRPSPTLRLSISAPTTSQELEAAKRGRSIAFTSGTRQAPLRGTSGAVEDDPRRPRLPSREIRYRNSTGQLQHGRHNNPSSSHPGSSASSRLNPRLPEGYRDNSRRKSMLADWAGRPRTNELTALGIPFRRRDPRSLIRSVDEVFRTDIQGPRQS